MGLGGDENERWRLPKRLSNPGGSVQEKTEMSSVRRGVTIRRVPEVRSYSKGGGVYHKNMHERGGNQRRVKRLNKTQKKQRRPLKNRQTVEGG